MTRSAALLEPRVTVLRDRERAGRTRRVTVPLNIITYNVHLLPQIAAQIAGERSQSGYRAQAIAEKLAHFDIVGLCEVFDRRCSRLLLETMQDKASNGFQIARGPRRSGRALIHSGLVLLSRYEILATHTVTFRNASRVVTHGLRADGFAAKGALHAQLRVGDHPDSVVDCFLTHLESRSARARRRQIQQLSAFIATHSHANRPVIALGDFNVAAESGMRVPDFDSSSPYRQLRRKLRHNGRRLVDVWDELTGIHGGTSDAMAADGGRRLDYIFVSDPAACATSRLTPQDVRAFPFVDSNVREGSLSDHMAVACRAEFSKLAEPAVW